MTFVSHHLCLEDWMQPDRREREKGHLSAHKRPLFCLADGPAATVAVARPENNSNIGKEKQLKEDYSEAPVWCRDWE